MSRLSDETVLFVRLAMFGVIVGAIYWFVTYETAGAVLLLGFGTASGVGAAVLWAARFGGSEDARAAGGGSLRSPVERTMQRIPAPAIAPLLVGLGAALAVLGLALGPLILPLAGLVVSVGARRWLAAAMHESDASRRSGPTGSTGRAGPR